MFGEQIFAQLRRGFSQQKHVASRADWQAAWTIIRGSHYSIISGVLQVKISIHRRKRRRIFYLFIKISNGLDVSVVLLFDRF